MEKQDLVQTCKDCGYKMLIDKKQGLIDRTSMLSGGYTGIWSAASGRTGMYTGSWNGPNIEPNGSLAFLHQKELVLNARDTENMLDAVTVMRQLALSLGESTLARLAGISANGSYSTENGILEQNVHIDAQFPNVKDSREIEEALNNLVNMASMRANRR